MYRAITLQCASTKLKRLYHTTIGQLNKLSQQMAATRRHWLHGAIAVITVTIQHAVSDRPCYTKTHRLVYKKYSPAWGVFGKLLGWTAKGIGGLAGRGTSR